MRPALLLGAFLYFLVGHYCYATRIAEARLTELVKSAEYIAVLKITSSEAHYTEDKQSWCAVIYRAEVVESIGPRPITGSIIFASDVALKANRTYLILLWSMKSRDNAGAPAQMFATLPRRGCPQLLPDLNTGLSPLDFEIRKSIVDGYQDSYLVIDSSNVLIPVAMEHLSESFRYCHDAAEDGAGGSGAKEVCDTKTEVTLLRWEELRRYLAKLVGARPTDP